MKELCQVCEKMFEIDELYVVEKSSYKQIIVCEKCMDKNNYWDESYYPLDEDYEYMDDEEKEGWDTLSDYFDKY